MTTVAESIVAALADHGVTQLWGVVGDALNPVTDAVRREDRLEWIGVRHEEVAAFAVSAQAQLTGRIGVCLGTVGPGSIHLLNGLYDAKKAHAPVLVIAGQVPSPEMGSDFFQEVDNDRLFADVAVFARTVTGAEQMPLLLEQAVNAAYAQSGVAVLTLPGDIGDLEMPEGARIPRFAPGPQWAAAPADQVAAAASALSEANAVTLLVGKGAHGARDEVLALAERLKAPHGPDPEGQGRAGARQPVRGGTVRADRQPGGRPRHGLLRRAVHGGHRLPVPGLVPQGQDGDPARRPPGPHRAAGGGWITPWWVTPGRPCKHCCHRCGAAAARGT